MMMVTINKDGGTEELGWKTGNMINVKCERQDEARRNVPAGVTGITEGI